MNKKKNNTITEHHTHAQRDTINVLLKLPRGYNCHQQWQQLVDYCTRAIKRHSTQGGCVRLPVHYRFAAAPRQRLHIKSSINIVRWRVQRDMGAHAQLGGKLLLASVGGSETSEMQRRQSERALTFVFNKGWVGKALLMAPICAQEIRMSYCMCAVWNIGRVCCQSWSNNVFPQNCISSARKIYVAVDTIASIHATICV